MLNEVPNTLKHSKVLLALPTLLVASSFFDGVPSLSALTLVVNNAAPVDTATATCPKSGYTTIGAALAFSRPGDLVYVCTGIYPEQITITDSITVAGQTGAEIQPSTFVPNGIDVNEGGSPLAAAVMVTPDPSNPSVTPVVTFYNFIVDGSNAPAGCSPSFAGIVYQDASGTIADNAVTNIQVPGGGNGCQTGLAIYVEGSPSTIPIVTVAQNSVHDYQKNGITVAGGAGLTATVEYNYVRGYGPVSFIAQNGIEFDSGIGAITSNTVSGNIYTGPDYQSTNLLIFANAIPVTANIIKDGDTAVYYDAMGALITKNSISNTTYDGIYFSDGSVTSNIVVDTQERAGGYAIEYYGTGTATATTNTILDANIGVAVDNTGATVTTTGNKYFATLVPTSNLGGSGGAPNRPAKRAVSPAHK
jgi:Right handed beta helix region